MNKHTPGPWRVIRKERSVGFANYEVAYSDAGELVCDVVYEESDATLLAAAPELLEALILAVDADGGTTYNSEDDEVGERSCCGEVSYKPHRQDCWVVKARAAIAKAKGETR